MHIAEHHHDHGGNDINDHYRAEYINDLDSNDHHGGDDIATNHHVDCAREHNADDHCPQYGADNDDRTEYVYVRRCDLDNLARHVHDVNVGAQRHHVHVLDSARRLVDNAILNEQFFTATLDTTDDDAALHAYLHQRAIHDAQYGLAPELRTTATAYLAAHRSK